MFVDFNDPLPNPSGSKKTQKIAVSEESLAMLMSMGFNRDQATKALRMTVRPQYTWKNMYGNSMFIVHMLANSTYQVLKKVNRDLFHSRAPFDSSICFWVWQELDMFDCFANYMKFELRFFC